MPSHPLLFRLDRDLAEDVEVLDRTAITVWLMRFSARMPLELTHPRMGRIGFEGVAFAGSVVVVFDRFVHLAIEDLVEKHVRRAEDQLGSVPTDVLDRVAEEAAGLIISARLKLYARASVIKGRLLGDGIDPKPAALGRSSVDPVQVHERLAAGVRALRQARTSEGGSVEVSQSALKRLNAAVESLRRAAGEDAFGRHLRRLSGVLGEHEFRVVSEQLGAGVNVEDQIAAARTQMGSMVGSARLKWPGDREGDLGLAISLIRRLAENRDEMIEFAYDFHYVRNDFSANLGQFCNDVIVPFRDDFLLYLEEQGWISEPVPPPSSQYNVTVHNPGWMALQQGTVSSNQSVSVGIDTRALADVLDRFAAALADVRLPEPEAADARAEIETLRAQLSKRNPSAVILREAGNTLRSMVENVVAGMMTPAAEQAARALWVALGIAS